MTWELDGWDAFHHFSGLRRYKDLEDLGYLTPRAIGALRNACGDDYTTLQLIIDVVARGPKWLPRMALGVSEDKDEYVAIHEHFWRKLRAMADLLSPD